LEEIWLEQEAAKQVAQPGVNDFQDDNNYEGENDKDGLENKSRYEVLASVLHLGKNVNSGHYVCYVKKNGKWIYYNDSRVNESQQTPLAKACVLI